MKTMSQYLIQNLPVHWFIFLICVMFNTFDLMNLSVRTPITITDMVFPAKGKDDRTPFYKV